MEGLLLWAVCLVLAAGLGAEASRPASNATVLQQLQSATGSLVCFITDSPCPRSDRRQPQQLASEQHPDLGAVFQAPQTEPVSAPNAHLHKPLLPLVWTDVVGMAATAAALVLAASGGVGGGPLLIPIFMLILGFRATSAVALSNVTIVGGTLTNFAFNVGRRHPLRPGPLVDWDLILVMEPSTILGALAGGYINHVLPPWITTVCLSLLLIFITLTLLRRGAATYRKETLRLQRSTTVVLPPPRAEAEALQQPSEPQCHGTIQGDEAAAAGTLATSSSGQLAGSELAPPVAIVGPAAEAGPGIQGNSQHNELTEPLLASAKDELSSDLSPSREPSLAAPLLPADAKVPEEEAQRWKAEVPAGKLGILLALLAGVAISDTVRTRLPCPSVPYWLAAVCMVPIALLVLAGAREYLLRKHARLASAPGYVPPEGAVVWTRKSTVVYPLLCTVAGLVAGMFGLGGGIVKGPLMLEMGVHPMVAAATSATMILFTSTAASTVFISYGAVQWDYASLLFLVALVATAVGQLGTKWVMRRMHGRSSIIVFAMAAFLGCSAVVLVIQGVFVTRRAFAAHEAWEWGSICAASHT